MVTAVFSAVALCGPILEAAGGGEEGDRGQERAGGQLGEPGAGAGGRKCDSRWLALVERDDGLVEADADHILREALIAATRVRIHDGMPPTGKRRNRPQALVDERRPEAMSELRIALRTRTDRSDVALMIWPGLWCELLEGGETSAMLGLIPGWLRWEPHGDLRLEDPLAVQGWLARWAPSAVAH